MAVSLDENFESLESVLAEHLPADILAKVNLSLRGPGSSYVSIVPYMIILIIFLISLK